MRIWLYMFGARAMQICTESKNENIRNIIWNVWMQIPTERKRKMLKANTKNKYNGLGGRGEVAEKNDMKLE